MKKFFLVMLAFLLAVLSSISVSANGLSFEDAVKIGREKSVFVQYPVPKIFYAVFQKMLLGENGGDISSILEKSEISVKNTEKLANRTAEQYLKASEYPCLSGKVAKGLTTDGKIYCESKDPLLAINIRIRSGEVSLTCPKTSKGCTPKTLTASDEKIPVYGEIHLATDGDKQAEILFEDNSLIRMDDRTKIALKPVPRQTDEGRVRTIAQASYNGGGLLWGRVLSENGPEFKRDEILVGVRGTSIMMTSNDIYVLQSQNAIAATLHKERTDTINIPRCSKISTSVSGNYDLIPSADKYCIGDKSDKNFKKILSNTRADIAYLNTLIAENKANENVTNERSIAAWDSVVEGSSFCTDVTDGKNTFWPNVLDKNEMCQPSDVIGLIKFEKWEPTFWAKDGNETKQVSLWQSKSSRLWAYEINLRNVYINDALSKLSFSFSWSIEKNGQVIGIDSKSINNDIKVLDNVDLSGTLFLWLKEKEKEKLYNINWNVIIKKMPK